MGIKFNNNSILGNKTNNIIDIKKYGSLEKAQGEYKKAFAKIAAEEFYKQAMIYIQMFYAQKTRSIRAVYPSGSPGRYSYDGDGHAYSRTGQILQDIIKKTEQHGDNWWGGIEIPDGPVGSHRHFVSSKLAPEGAVAHTVWVEGSHGREMRNFSPYVTKPSPWDRLKELEHDESFIKMIQQKASRKITGGNV